MVHSDPESDIHKENHDIARSVCLQSILRTLAMLLLNRGIRVSKNRESEPRVTHRDVMPPGVALEYSRQATGDKCTSL